MSFEDYRRSRYRPVARRRFLLRIVLACCLIFAIWHPAIPFRTKPLSAFAPNLVDKLRQTFDYKHNVTDWQMVHRFVQEHRNLWKGLEHVYDDPTSTLPLPEGSPDASLASNISQHKKGPSPLPNPPLPPPDEDEHIALCLTGKLFIAPHTIHHRNLIPLIVKNQTRDLEEFLRHHYHHHGIRRFYIHDDGTMPSLSDTNYSVPSTSLTFISHPTVEHNPDFEDRAGIQEEYYTDCATRFRDQHFWMGFLDVDELLEMTGNETLLTFLQSWEQNSTVGAVGVNWLLHTSSGLLSTPSPPTDSRKVYTKCIPDHAAPPYNDNEAIKTFVRLDKFESFHNVHCVGEMRDGAMEVGEHGDEIKPPCSRTPSTRERWALHHFATKSREEFEEKKVRGHIQGGGASEEWWEEVEGERQWDCLNLAEYVP
ncbi:uncharacterized protein KY384_007562 [Bacidia gigantensis]|uniref:uncharacterized protein n=1 Tax=Bacidia gigantensis TaxID=2732470 RepID=UPI001D052E52|nr:uncharacterized protein KY384_007562 [Bacidia gigantensis]KAG8527410.1 hypothetical protein KY384_007562 [Bacidia gigantensis]